MAIHAHSTTAPARSAALITTSGDAVRRPVPQSEARAAATSPYDSGPRSRRLRARRASSGRIELRGEMGCWARTSSVRDGLTRLRARRCRLPRRSTGSASPLPRCASTCHPLALDVDRRRAMRRWTRWRRPRRTREDDDPAEETSLETAGRGFVRAGADDAEDDDPAERDDECGSDDGEDIGHHASQFRPVPLTLVERAEVAAIAARAAQVGRPAHA